METGYRNRVTPPAKRMWPTVLDEARNACPSCQREMRVYATVHKGSVVHRYRICTCGQRAVFQQAR